MSSFGRRDYRDPARDKFGKPGISFQEGSVLHPRLVERFDHRKDSTAGALPFLSLSQNPRALGCYLVEQVPARGDDDSSNWTLGYDRLPGPVKTTYPIDETYGIVMKVQTQVVVARDNPPWMGARFSSEFTLTQLPSAGETVTIGSVTYEFVAALSGAADEVLIGTTVGATLFNLASAINLDWGIGVNFGTGTTANAAACAWFSIDTLVVADVAGVSAAFATTTTCAHGSWPGAAAATMLYIEEKEIDVNRVYRIASRVLVVPPDVSYWMGHDVSLPDTLVSAEMVWDQSASAGGSTQGRNSYGGSKAEASASNYVDGGLAVQIVNGFRGVAKAQYMRHFTLTAPEEGDIATPTIIKPSLGTVLIRTFGDAEQVSIGDLGTSFNCSAKVGVKTEHIGPVLVGIPYVLAVATTSSVAAWSGSGFSFVLTLSMTPTAGDTVSIGGKTYTWRAAIVGSVDGDVWLGDSMSPTAATALACLYDAIFLTVSTKGMNYATAMTPNPAFSWFSSIVITAATLTIMLGALQDSNFVPADAVGTAATPDPVLYLNDAVATAHAEGHAQLSIPLSTPAQFNSGDTITVAVSVQQWRLGLFMVETIVVTVP